MIIIDIDTAISKTDTIIFEIDIAYVSNLAHAWCQREQNKNHSFQNLAIKFFHRSRKFVTSFWYGFRSSVGSCGIRTNLRNFGDIMIKFIATAVEPLIIQYMATADGFCEAT